MRKFLPAISLSRNNVFSPRARDNANRLQGILSPLGFQGSFREGDFHSLVSVIRCGSHPLDTIETPGVLLLGSDAELHDRSSGS